MKNQQVTTQLQSFECSPKGTKSFEDAAHELQENTSETLKQLPQYYCPIDVLPEPLKNLINELHEKYKFPKDFCLMYLLFVASVAIGNNWRAEVKKNWHEPALLFICVVALAGQIKTPVQNFFTAVLKKINKDMFDRYKAKLEAWELSKKAATKENPFYDDKPIREQILIQDSTLEATIKALDNNGRGLGILFDELAGFFGGMNRYSNGGNEMPFYLSAYNCQSYTSNRKTSDDIYLSNPFLSIAGGIQPAILKKTFNDEMQDNGAKDRFLFCYPQDLKKEIASDEEIDQSLIDHYTDTITYIIESGDRELKSIQGFEREKYITIPFTQDARKELFDYLQANADQVNEYNDQHNYRLASSFSKFDYHVIRLSFIIQILTDANEKRLSKEITVSSVIKGIKLANYFKWHTKRIHSLVSGDPLAAYDERKRAFYNALSDSFTTAQAVEVANEIRKSEILSGLIKADAVEKWAKRFLETDLFNRPSHGNYSKKK